MGSPSKFINPNYRRVSFTRRTLVLTIALLITLSFSCILITNTDYSFTDTRAPPVYEDLVFSYNATVFNTTFYNATESLRETKVYNYLATSAENQRIGVVMAFDGKLNTYGFRNITAHGFSNRSVDNKKEFAELHGYVLIVDDIRDKTRPATWSKILTLMWTMETFPHLDWLWWVDMDTIIMQPQLSLESHLLSQVNSSRTDLVMCNDTSGIAAGSFLIRNSDWSRFFLDVVYDHVFSDLTSHLAPGFEHHEQSTFQHLYDTHPHVREHIQLINQTDINAYPHPNGTLSDEFLIHFAACSIHQDCDVKFEQFWQWRKTVEEIRNERERECLKDWKCL